MIELATWARAAGLAAFLVAVSLLAFWLEERRRRKASRKVALRPAGRLKPETVRRIEAALCRYEAIDKDNTK